MLERKDIKHNIVAYVLKKSCLMKTSHKIDTKSDMSVVCKGNESIHASNPHRLWTPLQLLESSETSCPVGSTAIETEPAKLYSYHTLDVLVLGQVVLKSMDTSKKIHYRFTISLSLTFANKCAL